MSIPKVHVGENSATTGQTVSTTKGETAPPQAKLVKSTLIPVKHYMFCNYGISVKITGSQTHINVENIVHIISLCYILATDYQAKCDACTQM